MSFSLEVPLNQSGLVNVGLGLVYELFERGEYPNIFPIGQVDLSSIPVTQEFVQWLQECCQKALGDFKKDELSIRLWHINGSQSKLSDNSSFWTVHETSEITDVEANILKQFSRVYVPSKYSQKVFDSKGVNSGLIHNFFDTRVFSKVEVKKVGLEDVTQFTLLGKLEKRKATIESIRAWSRRFGRNKKFRLNCLIHNPFLMNNVDPRNAVQHHKQIIENALQQQLDWNITIYPFVSREEYNLHLNNSDIDMGLSFAEGFGLPLLQTRCLGKRGLVLNAHGHLEFADSNNSTLIEPSGMQPAADGIFFLNEGPFNRGNIFNWKESDVMDGFDRVLAAKPADEDQVKSLIEKFSVKTTVDKLLADK